MDFNKLNILDEKIDILLKTANNLYNENQELKEKLKNAENLIEQYNLKNNLVIEKVMSFLEKLE